DIFGVGRVDKDSEGLLVISNDGEFKDNLMSGCKDVCKRYKVTCKYGIKKEDIIGFKNVIEV
ncbi:pseudouridine synthase, partial [Staphylococcus hominis]|uniref:pseudouridine synthase n=1 Tax=Staphylococcus hominis TaxID=1290 RepID=UPI0021B6732F